MGSRVEEHLSPAEVAKRLQVDRTTVFRWIQTGKLRPIVKLGHRITRVPASVVNAFLEERTVGVRQ